jgi:hypothetical protein
MPMELLESGDWLIPEGERDEYRVAAARMLETMEIFVDITKPICVEHAMYLKFCQICVMKDFDTAERAIAEFDRIIAETTTRH